MHPSSPALAQAGRCGSRAQAAGYSWPAVAPAPPGSRGWLLLCVCVVNDVMFASVGVKDLLVTFPLAWV